MVMPHLGKPKKEDIDDAVLNSEYDEKRKNYQIRNQLSRKYEEFKQKKIDYLFRKLEKCLDRTKGECDIYGSEFNPDFIDAKFSQKSTTINCKIGVVDIQFSEIQKNSWTNNSIYQIFYLKKCEKCKKEMCKEEFQRFRELLYLIDKYKEKIKCEKCLKNRGVNK